MYVSVSIVIQKLIPALFIAIAIYQPPDVRPILQAYQGKDIPLEYAKHEAEQKAKHIQEWKKKKGIQTSSFSSLFGLSSQPSHPASKSHPGIPPTYLEQKRHEAQLQYREEQKYIADNKENLEKLLAQDQAAAQQEMPGSLWEAFTQMQGKKEKEGGETQELEKGKELEKKA